jgi:hypothetical protein
MTNPFLLLLMMSIPVTAPTKMPLRGDLGIAQSSNGTQAYVSVSYAINIGSRTSLGPFGAIAPLFEIGLGPNASPGNRRGAVGSLGFALNHSFRKFDNLIPWGEWRLGADYGYVQLNTKKENQTFWAGNSKAYLGLIVVDAPKVLPYLEGGVQYIRATSDRFVVNGVLASSAVRENSLYASLGAGIRFLFGF